MELLGRYSKMSPPPQFTLNARTARRTARSAGSPARKRYKLAQRLTTEERSRLVAAYVAGASSQQLTQQFSLGKGPVLRILNEAGVTRKRRRMTQAQIAEAADLYAKGWSTIRLGQHFGFGPGTVWVNLKQQGVPMRQPWERLQA